MQNKIRFATESVNLCNQFVLCMFFFVVLQVLILEQPAPWYVQLTFLCLLLLAIAIRCLITNSLAIYLGLHLVLFLVPVFLPMNNLLTLETVFYLLLITMQSIHYWKHNGYLYNTSVPWFSFLIMFVFYIYGLVEKNHILINIIYIFGVAYLLLYLVKLYLAGLLDFSQAKAMNDTVPLSRITKINSLLIGFLLCITLITILISCIFNVDNLIFDIGKGILYIIVTIGQGISAVVSFIFSKLGGPSPTLRESSGNWEFLQNLPTERTWLTILLEVLLQITQLAIILAILFFIFRGIYRTLHQFLLQNLQSDDITEIITVVNDDKTSYITETLPAKHRQPKLSKIRRRYKKTILKYKDEIELHKAMTTNEIHNCLSEQTQTTLTALKDAYEAERYSNHRNK